jgi:hypothetical protein
MANQERCESKVEPIESTSQVPDNNGQTKTEHKHLREIYKT